MQTIRPHQDLDWFDFLDLIEKDLASSPTYAVISELIDEIYMRKLDSVSEGASYKLIAPCKKLWEYIQQRKHDDHEFCTNQEHKDLESMVKTVISITS